jgi:hypothetical protein
MHSRHLSVLIDRLELFLAVIDGRDLSSKTSNVWNPKLCSFFPTHVPKKTGSGFGLPLEIDENGRNGISSDA